MSDIIQEVLDQIPLETKLKTAFEMHDYDNWENGDYNGDVGKYADVAMGILKEYFVLKLNKEFTFRVQNTKLCAVNLKVELVMNKELGSSFPEIKVLETYPSLECEDKRMDKPVGIILTSID